MMRTTPRGGGAVEVQSEDLGCAGTPDCHADSTASSLDPKNQKKSHVAILSGAAASGNASLHTFTQPALDLFLRP